MNSSQRAWGSDAQQPLVSICIPTYNSEKTVERAITSAAAQILTYPSIELVIIDDRSSDATCAVIRRVLASIAMPTVFKVNDQNIGLIANHNECIHNARGRLIKFLHADDELTKGSIRRLVEVQIKTKAPIVFGPRIVISSDINWLDKYRDIGSRTYGFNEFNSATFLLRKFLFMRSVHNIIGEPSSVLLTKESANKVGGFRYTYPQLLDFDLWLRIANEAGAGWTDEPVAVRHHTSETVTVRNRTRPASRYDMLPYLWDLSRSSYPVHLRWMATLRWVMLLVRSSAVCLYRGQMMEFRFLIKHARSSAARHGRRAGNRRYG